MIKIVKIVKIVNSFYIKNSTKKLGKPIGKSSFNDGATCPT